MRFYIGAPIDTARQDPGAVLDELKKAIVSVVPDAVIYNPFAAWMNAGNAHQDSIEYVWAINDTALVRADLAVFAWTGCPSVGVPIEIYRRHREGLPFAVVNYTQKPRPGLYLQHLCGKQLFHTPEQFTAWLREWVALPEPETD